MAFDGVFIERQMGEKPVVERRELKSLFKPKSAQVPRVMLGDPRQPWRVTELADQWQLDAFGQIDALLRALALRN